MILERRIARRAEEGKPRRYSIAAGASRAKPKTGAIRGRPARYERSSAHAVRHRSGSRDAPPDQTCCRCPRATANPERHVTEQTRDSSCIFQRVILPANDVLTPRPVTPAMGASGPGAARLSSATYAAIPSMKLSAGHCAGIDDNRMERRL